MKSTLNNTACINDKILTFSQQKYDFKVNLMSYEDCSNMNASNFVTLVTYMLRQNGICFYKGLYITFKLAPDLKKNPVYLLNYSPLNEGYLSILTNSMLRT